MQYQSFISLSFTVLFMCFLTTSCNHPSHINIHDHSSHIEKSSTNDTHNFEMLNIAVIPHHSTDIQEQKINELAQYIKENIGIPVNIIITENYTKSIDLLVSEEVEMAYLGALSYIKAKELNPDLEAILAAIDKETGRPWYNSVIVANQEKGIKNIEDLKQNKSKFSFVNESSTSGYLMPLNFFKSSNINPEKDFGETQFSGSHDKNLLALTSEKVDAIAIDKQTYIREVKLGNLDPEKYKIIWESKPIPNPPIVINNHLPSGLILELKKVLINAPEGLVNLTGSEVSGYTLVNDDNYEQIREMTQRLNL